MDYLRFYDLEETYINDESSLEYFNVSYTKDTDYAWVKEKQQFLEMKFKVIAYKQEVAKPQSIEYNENSDLFIGNKICNDFSIFKKIIINDGEPIDLIKGVENSIQINSETVYSENDLILMTPLIYGSYKGVQIILDEPLRENDFLVINLFNDPNNMMGVNEKMAPEEFNFFFKKIDDLTYELTDEVINILSTENAEYSIFGLKEGAEPNDSGQLEINCASYIINTTLKYYEIPEVSLPLELDKEYIVKGELKDDIYSLPYGLFSNNFNDSEVESLDGTSDTNSNNVYRGQFINLIEINIPKNISEISNNAFLNNISLKNITFESNNMLEYIGENAFEGCKSLTSIDIPNSVTTIVSNTFSGCTSLTSITIPNSVTYIGYGAFYKCSSLSSIDIPNSVTEIDTCAFTDCSSLTSITIPNSVTEIGNDVFFGCESLSSITIPNSVTSIGNYTFFGCYSLSSITIPNSVTEIGNYAFKYCRALSSVIFEEGSQCTSIYCDAFYECRILEEITIPNSVTLIEENAFRECASLKKITIGNSVTEIDNGVFINCPSLSEITCLARKAPTLSYSFSYMSYNGVLYYPQGSDYSSWLSTSDNYLGYYGWVGVELQDSYNFKVNFITNGVRVDSPYNSLIINGIKGVKQSDNSYLFSGIQPTDGCYKFDLIADGEVIEKVDIRYKNKWITVGDNSSMLSCIYNTCQKTRIYSSNNLIYSGAYVDGVYVGTLSTSYTFNDVSEHIIQYEGVTKIGSIAFQYCSALTSITIPNSITSIGNDAFYSCYSLSEITIPDSVTTIGESVFSYCYSLSEITIPNSVTEIGNYAFANCFSLSSIEIPNSVTSIGTSAFSWCYSLSEITIPNSITSISDNVFYACNSLTSVTIPDSVTSIGESVFYTCDSLSSITIPNSVTSIGSSAFTHCDSLIEIDIPNGVTSISERVFNDCPSLTSVTIPDSVTSIDNYAFYGCDSLSNITIPNSVTSIGYGAFDECYSLTSITIPNSVTTIGENAFNYCRALSLVIFEEGSQCTSIEYGTFSSCDSLSEITIPNSITSIERYAFDSCYSLTSITIPNSVTLIGDGAFYNCNLLKSVIFEEGSQCTSIEYGTFSRCFSLSEITCLAETAPTISSNTFSDICSNGVLFVPIGSDYSSWINVLPSDWEISYLQEPQ